MSMNIELVESKTASQARQTRSNSVSANSRYIHNSLLPANNPEAYHSFFNDDPLGKFRQDIKRYKQISFKCPDSINFASRHYVVVEQKVTKGKPLTAQEFQILINKKTNEPQIITYGFTDKVEKLNSSLPRNEVEITTEGKGETGICNCWTVKKVNEKDIFVGKIQ